MPPRRAAAAKAAQANASLAKGDAQPAASTAKKPASRANSKKRVASPDPVDDNADEEEKDDEEEDEKPQKKRAKKASKSTDDTAVADPDPPPKIATMTRRGTGVPVDSVSNKHCKCIESGLDRSLMLL